MRLIDADKLLPKLWVCYEENKPIVDSEPTVEAIPIEWLEKWQGIQYCLQDEGKAKITVIEMLEDWRKENE